MTSSLLRGRCSGLLLPPIWSYPNHKKGTKASNLLIMAGGANYMRVAHPFGMGATVVRRPKAVGPQWPFPSRGARPQNVGSMVWCWPQTSGPNVVLATNRWSIGGGIEQCRQAAEAMGAQLRCLQLFSHHPKTKIQSGERRQSGIRMGQGHKSTRKNKSMQNEGRRRASGESSSLTFIPPTCHLNCPSPHPIFTHLLIYKSVATVSSSPILLFPNSSTIPSTKFIITITNSSSSNLPYPILINPS